MNKEMLDIVNDLSKKPTTELALQIMELSSENLILEQQCKKQKEVIDKTRRFLKDEGQKQYNIHDNYRGKWYSPDELDILNKILENKEVSE